MGSGAALPQVGLGLRRVFQEELAALEPPLACVEIITEQFISNLPAHQARLERLARSSTVLPHGLSLSVASVEPPAPEYLDQIGRLVELTHAPFVSDHFAFTRAGGRDLNHLSPMWLTDEGLETVVRNVRHAREVLGVPLVLETITRPFLFPASVWTEEAFISEVVRQTGCGILLDIVNVHINATNLGLDARAFIDALPPGAVLQYHLVGYSKGRGGKLVDLHGASIQEEVWELYRYALRVAPPRYVILERDTHIPALGELLSEVHRAEQIAREVLGARG